MNGATRNYDNTLQLKYNLADSALYVFQTTLTTDFSNQPYTSNEMWFSESGKPAYPVYRTSKGRNFTPALDLYFYHQLGKHQSLSADVWVLISTPKEPIMKVRANPINIR